MVEVGGHAGQRLAGAPAAAYLGAHGVEVDEPGFVEGAGDAFEGGVGAAVEVYLVVEGAEDAGDAALFGERGQWDFYAPNVRLAKSEARNSVCVCVKLRVGLPERSAHRKPYVPSIMSDLGRKYRQMIAANKVWYVFPYYGRDAYIIVLFGVFGDDYISNGKRAS